MQDTIVSFKVSFPPKFIRSIVPNDLTNLRKKRKRKTETHNMAEAMMAEVVARGA